MLESEIGLKVKNMELMDWELERVTYGTKDAEQRIFAGLLFRKWN